MLYTAKGISAVGNAVAEKLASTPLRNVKTSFNPTSLGIKTQNKYALTGAEHYENLKSVFGADNVKWEKNVVKSNGISTFDDYAKTPFLPDEYYTRMIDVKNFYQEPNTAQKFVRIGKHSKNWEESITVSDNYGRLKYRIDRTDHGMPQDHLNLEEHVHVFEINIDSPKTSKNGIKWFSDDNFWYKKSRPPCQPLDVIK